MSFPGRRPPATGGYQDDATIPDSARLNDLSSDDLRGSAGDLTDQYEDEPDGAGYDEDFGDSYDFDDLGDDDLSDDGAEFDPRRPR